MDLGIILTKKPNKLAIPKFHKALSTNFGAWNTHAGAPNTEIVVLNTKILFLIS